MSNMLWDQYAKCIMCDITIDKYVGGYARDWFYIYCIKCFRKEYFND